MILHDAREGLGFRAPIFFAKKKRATSASHPSSSARKLIVVIFATSELLPVQSVGALRVSLFVLNALEFSATSPTSDLQHRYLLAITFHAKPIHAYAPMDDSAKTVALVEYFGDLPPDIVPELLSMLRSYGLNEQDLFYKWEYYCIKMGPDDTKLNLETVRAFKKDTQEQLEKNIRAKTRQQSSAVSRGVQKTPRHKGSGDTMALSVSLALICSRVMGRF